MLNKVFSGVNLSELLERTEHPATSIYMPTTRGIDGPEDQIRFKNLMSHAEKRMLSLGLRRPDVDQITAPAVRLVEHGHFWRHQLDGLAVFMAPDFFRYHQFPLRFQEQSIVADRFNLRPILPWLWADRRYFVLMLGLEEPKLYQGTLSDFDEVSSEWLSPDARKALTIEKEKQLQFHTVVGRGPVYHGHDPTEETKIRVAEYVQSIAKDLDALLIHARAPLIVSGVDYVVSRFREYLQYAYLLPDNIAGSPAEQPISEVRQRALQIARSYFERDIQTALERYAENGGSKITSSKLEEVIRSSYEGRVDTIFLENNREIWGSFEPETENVQVSEDEISGSEDLVNFAALQTWRHGGKVFSLSRERMPSNDPVAAILRY